jgi:hypothetical protein
MSKRVLLVVEVDETPREERATEKPKAAPSKKIKATYATRKNFMLDRLVQSNSKDGIVHAHCSSEFQQQRKMKQ